MDRPLAAAEPTPSGIVAIGDPPSGFPIVRDVEVEPRGLEPLTFWLPARRSPS